MLTTEWPHFQVLLPLLFLFSCLVVFSVFVTPWTVAHHAPLSMGFPRQEEWSGFLLTQGSNPCLLHMHCQVGSLSPAPPGKPLLPLKVEC